MRLLKLLSGTGSVGEVFRERGWEVISLDINPKSNATIIADILTWDYRKLPDVGYFRGDREKHALPLGRASCYV